MLIQHLSVKNLLSFGDQGMDLSLKPLNVLVGPNGSGKSNVLEVLGLLRALPNDLLTPMSEGGGMEEWFWKGAKTQELEICCEFEYRPNQLIHHCVSLNDDRPFLPEISREKIWDNEYSKYEDSESHYYYLHQGFGKPPTIWDVNGNDRKLGKDIFEYQNSILAQVNDPVSFPSLSFLSRSYRSIRLYREWTFGRRTIFRQPQRADQRKDYLAEDFSNLGLFLNKLGRTPSVKRELITALQDLYEGLDGYEVIIEGGTVQVFFTEGDFSIPATRLSDGTLRYLALLALLLDPTPPRLIGLEEPELGLHPDLIPKVADLLIAASERTQLIVTTHSDILIDALSKQPDSVLICEKHEGQTQIERLDRESLGTWLERYRLGELWTRGELGGTRW